ncbi:hypothetical protein HanIR_Chr13g0667781 [Helianthus annuus]|nr:hypothetical protein HanIR_Chr13g0667781 [Helianthus annuus]
MTIIGKRLRRAPQSAPRGETPKKNSEARHGVLLFVRPRWAEARKGLRLRCTSGVFNICF